MNLDRFTKTRYVFDRQNFNDNHSEGHSKWPCDNIHCLPSYLFVKGKDLFANIGSLWRESGVSYYEEYIENIVVSSFDYPQLLIWILWEFHNRISVWL